MTFVNGQTIGELYEVIATFGGGGMGLVHRARHRVWNIEVAIKHPRREFLGASKQIANFHTECSTWAEIGLHPYVATCYYSREIEGLPCVVAEYLPGGSVQDAIQGRELYKGEESACLATMLAIAASTAWGLARAHESGLIHCDVKPGNMLLTSHGVAKIADFGLAVSFRPNQIGAKASGLTVAFAAPEQIRGESLSPAADVWSWAASMLAMFTGGVTWESGAACGAVLGEFLEVGGKAYRIPPMPEPFAALLKECFCFASDARLSDFGQIARRICQCYEDLFGEPCPASKPDLELISADSLNNRAVSRFDLGDNSGVRQLFDEALAIDPLHPEANFNSAVLEVLGGRSIHQHFLGNLEHGARFGHGEWRPRLYRAYLLNLASRSQEALGVFETAREIADPHEALEVQRLWDLSKRKTLTLVLAPPISGEDYALDLARFRRLMQKSETAIADGRYDDARRYLMMSGDIPRFGRHTQRRRLFLKIP